MAQAISFGFTMKLINSIGKAPPPLCPTPNCEKDVKPNDNAVDIKWSTAAEKNNDYFTIERSTDGHSFENIEQIEVIKGASSALFGSSAMAGSHPSQAN